MPNRGISARWMLLCLLVLSAGMYLGMAGSPALDDEDGDAAHALVAQEMLKRGDFAVMYMDGIRYLIRPPMHFWLVAASYATLGESEFATRLPLGLAVIGLVLLTFEFGRRFLGKNAGFYAALAIGTSVGVFIFTRNMLPEALNTLAYEAIIYLFLRAWTGSLDPRLGYWGAAVVAALAVLTRGPIGVLFPGGAIVAFITMTRSWHRWKELRLFSSSIIFLVIALPWHFIAGSRAPGFYWDYFVNEHLNRALGKMYPHDYGTVPLWLWWSAHLLWLFPWSFFFPLALRELPRPMRDWGKISDPAQQARLLLYAWAGIILLFFTIESGSRLEYYSFGAWPALALLLGLGIARSEETDQKWLRPAQRMLAGLGAVFALVAGYFVVATIHISAASDVADHLDVRSPDEYLTGLVHVLDLTPQSVADLRVPILLSSLSLFVAFVVAWALRERGIQWYPNIAMTVGMVGFVLAAYIAYNVMNPTLSSRALAHEISKTLRPEDQVAIYGAERVAPGIPFYTHHRALLYNATGSNLEFGAHYPDAPKTFYTDKDFLPLWSGPGRVLLVVPEEHKLEAEHRLPAGCVWVLADMGGKIAFVNQPPTPGQAPVTAELGAPISISSEAQATK